MCTALHVTQGDCYFGRNLDLDRSYGEEVCVMPHNFPLSFRAMGALNHHYAIVGMATVIEGLPLFYEGTNEHGLSMAGLNFPGNAHYFPFTPQKDNVTPFEFLPWILGQCKSLSEVEALLPRISLWDKPFSDSLPLSPLHWIIADKKRAITVESTKNGLEIYENKVGVLTNNPPFPYHMAELERHKHLSVSNKGIVRDAHLPYNNYCAGLGAVGLPGDVSSLSRFVRMTFGSENAQFDENELQNVGQFFHLLSSVEMIKGLCQTDEGTWDMTVYSACCNMTKGIYYYTTYTNRQITAIAMRKTDLDQDKLSRFPLRTKENIFQEN